MIYLFTKSVRFQKNNLNVYSCAEFREIRKIDFRKTSVIKRSQRGSVQKRSNMVRKKPQKTEKHERKNARAYYRATQLHTITYLRRGLI